MAAPACTESDDAEPSSSDGDSGVDPDAIRPQGGNSGSSGDIIGLDAGRRDAGASADGGMPPDVADASGGDDGATDGGSADSGTDAATSECAASDTYRCTAAGREHCEGGEWVSDPCPLDVPACSAGACVLRGPEMVRVGAFYIDSTEVTVAHYIEFLDATGDDTSGQPEVCSWNTSFHDGTPVDPDAFPITMVDWCDARAYCDWAGKRLCGAIEGGAVDGAAVLDESVSQWFLACGSGGSHPNNNADCNSSGGNGLEAVATHPDCEGYYPGLFDMEGNAAEWVDGCESESGGDDICHLLGGSHIDNQSYCTESFDYPRSTTAEPFGFRCCSG